VDMLTPCTFAIYRKFVDAIQGYQGDDPLEAWLQYIKWTKDTFSAGGHKSELLPLLERCTREFHLNKKYQDDARYLRVWIQYVRIIEFFKSNMTYILA